MRWITLVSCFFIPFLSATAQSIQHGLRIPAGFEITEFADSTLANDIYCLTLDPKGRVVVSGRGYIRILIDDNQDGRADRAVEFADGPRDGAMGMLWEGKSLFVTGDGGLRRYSDENGDDRADGPPELLRRLVTGSEHGAHDIRRGPDGWLYVLCGNSTRIDKSYAQLPTSPNKEPIGGCVIRLTPDLKQSEIVADGFRNPYGMDFNADGELFTYDSDNERCVSLPWYEFTRFYHVIPGGHYGWQNPQRAQWWRLPPYFPDVVAPVAYLGRGSPTGVACYRHVQFPAPYRGGFFCLDWTFGRVYFLSLKRAGSTYSCEKQVFLESVGDNGFAPTGVVVHPKTGDLFISIGGRGTRGAIYRIRYPAGLPAVTEDPVAKLQPKPRSLDWLPNAKSQIVVQATEADAPERLRALALIRRHQPHFEKNDLQKAILANWGHVDRHIRQAVSHIISGLPKEHLQELHGQMKTPLERLTFGRSIVSLSHGIAFEQARYVLSSANVDATTRLEAVRLLQLALGDLMSPRVKDTVWEGYTARPPRVATLVVNEWFPRLGQWFPSGNDDLDREVTRTLALVEDESPEVLTRTVERITATSFPVEDIHYLIVTARLRAPRSAEHTKKTAAALLALDRKLTSRNLTRDTNWPLRIAELYAELSRKDPALNDALLAHPEFGRPDHALFARTNGFDRRRAALVFLAKANGGQTFAWNADIVELVGTLPEEQALPVLRRLWENMALRETILGVLARQPKPEDRDKFLEVLGSAGLPTMRTCLSALERLPPAPEGKNILELVRMLRRLSDQREERGLGIRVGKYLQAVTGQNFAADKEAWTAWFTKQHPELAERLVNADGVDVAAWKKRLAGIDWDKGDSKRGNAVFMKVGCAACHAGTQAAGALGPDLRGVASRFSRDDLFTAILQPSRDVSPRYQTTLISTADGKLHQGSIAYEAVDSLILQTGSTTTVRVAVDQIAERRNLAVSLMPAGLLDKASDGEIADLYAYLREWK